MFLCSVGVLGGLRDCGVPLVHLFVCASALRARMFKWASGMRYLSRKETSAPCMTRLSLFGYATEPVLFLAGETLIYSVWRTCFTFFETVED